MAAAERGTRRRSGHRQQDRAAMRRGTATLLYIGFVVWLVIGVWIFKTGA